MNRIFWLLLSGCWGGSCQAPCAGADEPLVWQDLLAENVVGGWQASAFGISGKEEISAQRIILGMGNPFTGVTWHGVAIPQVDYEIELVAQKTMGVDFFCGLTFPVGEDFCTLVLGGWGGSLTGLSCIDDIDASQNFTRSFHRYDLGVDYTIRLRVEQQRLRAWLQDGLLFDVDLSGQALSIRPEVQPSLPLGIACYNTATIVSAFRVRTL